MNNPEFSSNVAECFWLLRRSRLFDLLIIAVAMTLLGRADAQTAPNVEDAVGVNVALQDLSSLLQTPVGVTFFQNTGVQWVRVDLVWQNVETTKGTFDFSNYDSFISLLPAGVQPYFILRLQ